MVMIAPDHGLAFFPVPKTACTSFMEMLHFLNTGELAHTRQDALGVEGMVHRLNPTPRFSPALLEQTAGLRRFAIVRDPVERILSCWRNRVKMERELTPPLVSPEALAALALPPEPDFPTFLARLAEYCRVSGPIRYHAEPHHVFLGPDPDAFDALFCFDALEDARQWLEAATGRALPRVHLIRSEARVPKPEVTPEMRRTILELYRGDAPFLERVYAADGTPRHWIKGQGSRIKLGFG